MNKPNLYQVHHGQSWVDISLKIYGTADYAFELALLNKASITQEAHTGTFIIFDPNLKPNKTILVIYENNQTNPATAFFMEDEQVVNQEEGISIWAINLDFVIKDNSQ